MLVDMKEQQAQSDHDWEWEALDRENIIHEREGLRRLNEQLQAQNRCPPEYSGTDKVGKRA